MSTVFNISPPIDGLNVNVRSVRCWFYPIVHSETVEVPPDQAHFVRFQGFPNPNAGGTAFPGFGTVDTGQQTAMAMYRASTVQALLEGAFS